MKRLINENYHNITNIQSKIILDNNFTYRNLIGVLKMYVKNNKSKILDIGCGVGTIDFLLASKGNTVTGIDESSNAINAARASSRRLNLNNKTRFIRLDFPNENVSGKYDLILLTEVIEHLKNDTLAIKKISGLLKKQGVVILSTPSKNAPLYKMGLLKDFDKNVGHLRRYTIEELIIKMKRNNFEIIYSKKTEGIIRNFLFTNKFANKFVRYLKWMFSDMIAFVDETTIPLLGESQIYLVLRKR